MNSTPVVQIKNLTSGYEERVILQDISLEIPEGQITVILGTSGCGKTTLLKHMIGLKQPTRGEIFLLGKNLLGLGEREAEQLFRRVGVLFQNGALLGSLPIHENVAIPLQQHTSLPDEVIEDMVRVKLALVGLESAYYLYPSELSGGMRKRAAVARAIALDPQVLFADEPAAGLDPVTAASLDDLLLSLKQQLRMTLVVVTHEIASIKRIADRIIYLHDRTVLFAGTLQDALQSELEPLRRFFNAAES
ncbi:MAG TPA: ATP-binding cassette domain-containing protein [Caldithrix abyssi]|uniref:ATP-binding cassette domain-containing protein n=1 Tax=Caldithrix abyssi TaxID=187145 RepID=A0A7V5UEH8_CALAY|nr:ATP-binding cassette domain-containing protein [Caldithrix abyssi]